MEILTHSFPRRLHPSSLIKGADDILGCSEALIRKRLKQLSNFHDRDTLIADDGALTESGFQAIARLGEIGLAAYRAEAKRQAQQQTAARQQEVGRHSLEGNIGIDFRDRILDGCLAIPGALDPSKLGLGQPIIGSQNAFRQE